MDTHHAIVFEGSREAGLARATTYVAETIGVPHHANPDVVVHVCDQYTIDDARALKERAAQTPLSAAQAFILAFDRITLQAQSALLKLLEEPAPDTYVIIIVPTLELLLATVRSRLVYGGRCVGTLAEAALATSFLGASVAERLTLVTPIVKTKDRYRAAALVDALESTLHGTDPREHASSLREVLFVRTYLGDTSSSVKMLLEHLAVTL